MKRIWFKPSLVARLRGPDPPRVTYRTHRLNGVYKVVVGDWFHARFTGVVIEVFKSEEVNARDLTDGDAALAGVASVVLLRDLFRLWYQTAAPKSLYRNWLRILEPTPDRRDPPRECYVLGLAFGGGLH